MQPTLHIRLLGDFRLVYGEELVTSVDTPRLQSLLAYLALHRGTPQARRHVAFTFWPDSTEKQAFNNLRNLVYVLRRAWPDIDAFLQVDTQTLLWKEDVPFTLDVATFERFVAEGEEALQRGDELAAHAAFEQAVEQYQGELLPDCYDEWIFPERERLHQQCTRVLERLIPLLEAARDIPAAIHHAQHLLRLDPLREASYRQLMRLHALNRDRARVLQTYQTCVQVLKDELGLDPEPTTQQLYERLVKAKGEPEPTSSDRSTSGVPLVGRHEAWTQLQAAWHTAVQGQAHLMTVTGQAGIGKTRLAEELVDWTQRQGFATAQTQCYAAEGRLAYAPIVDWLRVGPLRKTLSTLDPVWLAEVARLLPELRTEEATLPAAEPLTESWQRRRLFEALARAVLAHGRPLLLLIDDLQWCDRDTLEWLHFLLRFAPEARLLILGTVRVEDVGPLHPLRELLLGLGRTGQTADVILTPLDAAETATLAAHLAGQDLDGGVAEQLYRETEGNPLFVVESMRAGLPEADASGEPTVSDTTGFPPPRRRKLPPTVQAVITKRLTQLTPAAQALAGLAATIGRAFSFDVLVRASYMDGVVLMEALDELWQRHVVRERDGDHYDFTHDKLREAAYADMSPPRRRLLHRRVAEALEATRADDPDAVSAQLAVHFERAGQIERAVDYYERAAHVAEQVYAHREAIRHFERARSLLHTLPANAKRDEQELVLLASLGLVLRLEKGHGAPEVGEVFEEARTLCRRLDDETHHFAVQRGLWSFHLIRADYEKAQALGEELTALADRREDPALRLEACIALGLTHCWQGAPAMARDYLEQGTALYNPEQHRAHAYQYGQNPSVTGHSVLALVQWLLGYPEQATDSIRAATRHAEDIDHPFSLAYALQHAALVYMGCRDAEATYDRAKALEQIAGEYGFAYWVGPALILQGWALTVQGQPARGLDLLRQGIAEHRATGATFQSTLWLGLLAEAYHRAAEFEEALDHTDAARKAVRETGEGIWLAELYRLRGELLTTAGDDDEAAACFRQALDVAQEQQARSLELRAAVSQARRWRRQGRAEETFRRLSALTSRFTEGRDTPDLQDARTLLRAGG